MISRENISGVMIDFRGMIFYFSYDIGNERKIGHLINVKNDTIEFVPLKTEFPLHYCDDHSPKYQSCTKHFYYRQVLSHKIHFDFT